MTVTATFPLYPCGETRIKKSTNERKDKTEERWKFLYFFSRKKVSPSYFLSPGIARRKHSNVRGLSFVAFYPILSLLSHRCHNVILKLRYRPLCRYCTLEALSTEYKYKQLSSPEWKRKRRAKLRYTFMSVIVASTRLRRTTMNAKLFMHDSIATLYSQTENRKKESIWGQAEEIRKKNQYEIKY